MNKGRSNAEYADTLAERVRGYRKKVAEAEEAKRQAERQLEEAQRNLESAERFYKMELEKLGLTKEQVRLPLEEKAVFAGMTAKEACVALLKESAPMTLEELVAALEKGGFVFSGSPKRVVNMALTGRKDIERLPGGRFRYKKRILPIEEMQEKYKKS